MVLHEPTDDERYLAQPRLAPVILTTAAWALGALAAALLVLLDGPMQTRALALYTGSFGGPTGGDAAAAAPTLRLAGVVVFAIAGFLVGLFSTFLTDLIDGVPKVSLRWSGLGLVVLWIVAVAPFALVGFPLLIPVVAGLAGWMRSRGFTPISRRTQTAAWVVLSVIAIGALGVLMLVRPDLATVIRFA
ncbi:hypothetical protein [Roseospira goensis]|uniref:Uncharacterized protein n=1 Tax=Roseospira goensis TaxID=391922 RepID=A0A7W6WKQ3_9PROT|nr:hypothetical protein [Roseospira goensis]MBB4286576.1 hypothetical protein [Roseospira goensis]